MSQQDKVQDYSWRIMPEISPERQEELKTWLATVPDIKQGVYPLKGKKLSRADVEWLLTTHENGRGPVDWDEKSQRKRLGIDLRGVDFKCKINLSGLPLSCVLGGLTKSERAEDITNEEWEEQCKWAAIHLEDCDLQEAHLEGARLQYAYLNESHLESARLQYACLKGSDLETAHLEGARLYRADLTGANLRYVYLDRTSNLDSIDLNEAKVADARWGDVNLGLVAWERVKILGDELEANNQTIPKRNDPDKEKNDWLWAYRKAIRANRQVATILRDQGWDEVAEKLDYRARVLQRKLIYRQGLWRKTGLRTRKKNPPLWWSIRRVASSYFSLLLDWIAGYGYKPWRWFRLYLLTIIVFAIFHYSVEMPLLGAFSINVQNLHAWLDAFFRSVLALHGRSFTVSSDPHSGINTVEAFVGLVIEAILIAIITKRILGKSGGGD